MTKYRNILLTGGSGKLGRSLLQEFLKNDFNVIATCSRQSSKKKLLKDFAHCKNNLKVICVDFNNYGAVEKLVKQVLASPFNPEILINNARSQKFLFQEADGFVDQENFLGEYLIDVYVPYELSIRLAKSSRSKLKKIINIGSQYGIVAANPYLYSDNAIGLPIQYSVAKAALHHLTKELAVRLAPSKISVNCVAFGGVSGRVDHEFKERYAKLCPSGKMLNDDEVSGPIKFLVSNESSSITGHVLVADGGWTTW